jgi:hypothetical protein
LELPVDVIDPTTLDSIANDFNASLLDDELGRLPERYRLPLLLCVIEGNSREQAAQRLGWSLGSVKGRLERARAILCSRLLRRGVSGAVVLAAIHFSSRAAQAAVPGSLIVSTAQAATCFASGQVAVGFVSQSTLSLALGALRVMSHTHWKTLAGTLVFGSMLSLAAISPSPAKEPSRSAPKLVLTETASDAPFAVPEYAALAMSESEDAVPATRPPGDDKTNGDKSSDAAAGESAPSAELAKEIEDLLLQIRSAKFSQREAATSALRLIGKPAIPALQKALSSDAPEVRVRAQSLLYHIMPETRPRESVVVDSVNTGQSASIAAGTYKQVLVVDVNGDGVISSEALRADELRLGSINGTAKITLKGTAKKLSIGYVNGACEIDASELVADSVEIGEIHGAPRINLRSTGEVRFTGGIDGGAVLDVLAGGDVSVEKGVGGGVRLDVRSAKNFTLAGDVGEGVSIGINFSGSVRGIPQSRGNIRTTQIEAKK